MTVELTKTTSHTTVVAELASQSVGGEAIFPTYLVTSGGTEIGTAGSPVYVAPGTGALWAVTGPLTDTQLRASAVPVSLASIPLGTDAATATKQDAQTTHLATLAGAVSAAKVQADVISSALPSGAATSAKQDSQTTHLATLAGAVTLGKVQVDVISSAIATGAATTAKQDTIIASLSSIDGHVDGVEGSLSSIDAKITACNTGAVVVASSALPTNAATSARQDTGNASLASIDGKIPALGQALAAASVPVVLTAAQLSALTPLSSVAIASALPAGTNAIGKLAANSGVTIGAVEIAATQTLGTVTTVGTVTNLSQLGGVNIAMGTGVRSAGTQRVTIATDDVVPCSQSGTWNVGTVTTVTTCSTVTTLTGGGVAHDGVDSGNPHKIGFKATTSLSGATMVAAGDRTDAMAGIDGAQIVRPHCNLEDIVSGVAAITDGSSTSVIAAQGAGVKVYVTAIAIANSSATAVTVDIRDGAAGTVKMTLPVPASTSGVVLPLPVPLPFSANTAVCADPSAAASTVTVTLVGFKSKI